jgi:hypothetical protein
MKKTQRSMRIEEEGRLRKECKEKEGRKEGEEISET